MANKHIGLLSDSFPPTIDGVAQTVKNYATCLQQNHGDVTVVTPAYKNVRDDYPFDVFRYQSVPLDPRIGYRAGNVFNPEAIRALRKKNFDLLHIHVPFASSILAEKINPKREIPTVLTYHTKFEVDFERRMRSSAMRRVALEFVLRNVNAVDEVWAVTQKCGDALRAIGYKGEYRVMENGTDFVFGKAEGAKVDQLRADYRIPEDAFVFLFVGRMMWYKNIRLMLDMLRQVKEKGLCFRCFMIGGGLDVQDMAAYAKEIGLSEEMIFTGPIYDREYLRVFYSLSDLFLFPSTYDTSGIVVKEAAACQCPSLMIRDSCASEGAVHNVSGFLAEESADDCARVLLEACGSRERLTAVGEEAGRTLYLSWEDAVKRASARYDEILRGWNGPKNTK